MPSVVVMLFTLIPPTVLFIILFLSFRGHEKSKASKKLPPGNPWILPLIGETLHFCKPHPSSSIGEFMEHQMAKFGRIFSSHLMGSRTIVSTDAELNRFVLRSEMRLFGPGWPPGMKVLLGKDSIPLLAGDPHKDLRSVLVTFLNRENRRNMFLEDANELALLRISSWDKKPVISATDEAAKFTLSVIVKNVLSMSPGDPVNEKLRQEYDIFRRGLTSFPIHLPGTSFWKASKTVATACIFLVSKVEDTPCSLENVGIVAYETMCRRDSAAAQRIYQKPEQDVKERQKALIGLGERVLLSTIRFDFNIQHPYKPLLESMRKLGISQKDVKQAAWNFVNDWHASDYIVPPI